MTFLTKNWIGLAAIVIAAIALVLVLQKAGVSFGGVTNYDEVDTTALKVGTNGSRIGPIITNTCSLISPNFTVTASTTAAMDCAVTGVVSGDLVDSWLATSTALQSGWTISGSSASSTAGFITVRVFNGTGANNVIPASLASSTPYFVFHPLTSAPGL